MAKAERSIVINAPPEKVFAVITDYEKYPEFLPEVKKVKVEGGQGSIKEVTYMVDIKAKVITVVKAERRIARLGNVVATPPIPSTWKLENGQWYWCHIAEKFVDTPFGRIAIPDEKDVERERKIAEFKKVSDGIVKWQNKETGLWWQVLDQHDTPDLLAASAVQRP